MKLQSISHFYIKTTQTIIIFDRYRRGEASFLLRVIGSCDYALIHPTVEKRIAALCLYGVLIDCGA